MWRGWLWRVAQLLLSLICAILLACALSALARQTHGFLAYSQSFAMALIDFAHGRFGTSVLTGRPAFTDLETAWPATLGPFVAGGAIALALGIPLGIVLTNKIALGVFGPFIQILSAVPVFVMCLLLALWNARAGSSFAGLLPSMIVGGAGAACLQILLRRASGVTSSAPYRMGLRMMGLGAVDVDLRYALPELVSGVCESLGEFALVLLTTTAVVEFVFAIPGAASLFFSSATHHDWTVMSLILFAFASTTLIADFLGWVIAHILVRRP